MFLSICKAFVLETSIALCSLGCWQHCWPAQWGWTLSVATANIQLASPVSSGGDGWEFVWYTICIL